LTRIKGAKAAGTHAACIVQLRERMVRTARLVGLCAAPVLAAAALAAGAGDFERGKTLYNARCVGCHDRSVHQREARKALTIEGIKAQVRRWDAFLKGSWRESEVNDVTTYLNELYYGYPCTPEICPEKKAARETFAADAPRR